MELVTLALDIMRRRLKLFLVLFVIIFIGGVAGVYIKRASFESSAKMLVNLEGLGVSLSQVDIPQLGPQVQAIEAITTQVELLTSRQLIEDTVDKLGLEVFRSPPPGNVVVRLVVGAINGLSNAVSAVLSLIGMIETLGERDAIVEALSSSLRVYPVRQSQIIVVSLRWRNPTVPPLALQTLLDLYFTKTKAIDTKHSEFDLFTEQVSVAAAALSEAEGEMRAFRLRYDVADLLREKQMLIDRIDRLTAMGEVVHGDAGNAAPGEGIAIAVERANRDVGGVVDQLVELHSRLTGLRVERARAATTFTAEHRTVRELDNQIATTEATLVRENTRLASLVTAARERLRVLQDAEQEFNRISRHFDMATQAYQTYSKVARDRALALAHETTVHIQVIDPPDTPLRATGPSRLIWTFLVFIVSLLVAALVTLAVDALYRLRQSDAALAGVKTIDPGETVVLRS
jgi:uncharacterized protein involved in exopolysaccharide biosynthesis